MTRAIESCRSCFRVIGGGSRKEFRSCGCQGYGDFGLGFKVLAFLVLVAVFRNYGTEDGASGSSLDPEALAPNYFPLQSTTRVRMIYSELGMCSADMQKRLPTCRAGCPRCENFAADVCGWLSEMQN